MHHVALPARTTETVAPLLDSDLLARFDTALEELCDRLEGRRLWHVSSTERGGGVAELLSTLLPYALGAGASVGWLVLDLDPSVLEVTKRVHNLLHGSDRDLAPPGPADREAYDAGLAAEAGGVLDQVAPGDLVVLHDPQTAGLIPALRAHGAQVMWRCHIGADEVNDRVAAARDFLVPQVRSADLCIFSRPAHVWEELDRERTAIVQPCIDIVSPKNRDLGDDECNRLLRDGRLVASTLEVAPIPESARLVLQVSRWDRLKDPIGVLRAFVDHGPTDDDVHLCLAGPATDGVDDDPEGATVYAEVRAVWEALPPGRRGRVHLMAIPMDDLAENALTVNALQRRADVVVQKSLAEGFGLTVAEAMWKRRPVVASRVGGIQDQIEHGTSGWLLDDPSDLRACGQAIAALLDDGDGARALGEAAHDRVCERFLPGNHVASELAAIDRLAVLA